ncbi:hypothetical protein P8935_02425 [Telmatobacter sp. DSM 110680]|uniref:Uncharacterized protein n=1 Tax=Telmatobacter sp. DSM 110680 TaxID=3036704 RepID=A0AAU7DN76_9BACT
MNLLIILLAMCAIGPRLPSSIAGLSEGLFREFAMAAGKTTQSGQPEGSLPADRYQQLRLQTLAHARLITGPRIKNPRIAAGGLDRDVVASLAEQRLWRQSHLGTTVALSQTHPLLSDQATTLLPTVHTISTALMEPAAGVQPLHSSVPCIAPTIRSVNGKAAGPVFTPAEPDNHFHLEGCSFGQIAGTVRLQLSSHALQPGVPAAQINLRLDGARAWKDDAIDVYIDPGLRSVSDFVGDLIIQFPNGQEAQLNGCSFVASRGEPQLFKNIPAAWVALDATATSVRAIQQLEFESPPFTSEQVPPGAVGTSAFVARSDPSRFSTGKDSYDLSQLAPGWMVESVQLSVFDASCPGENVQAESQGNWTTNWSSHGFVIAWASETCANRIPPHFNFNLNSSQYAVRVWLIGPAGTQPLRSGF